MEGGIAAPAGVWGSAGGLRLGGLEQPAEQPARPGTSQKAKWVECDAMVLLKIIKTCRDGFPTPVNGQLLGMDVVNSADACLEVTDCFALPSKGDLWNNLARDRADAKDVEDRVNAEQNRYGSRMVELLQTVNADCLTVGWYQTMTLETFKDVDVIDSLCEYQDTVENAVIIGFDPTLGSLGLKAFRAYRVSSEFLALHRDARNSNSLVYKQLRSSKDILEELPIRVRDPLLVEAFLLEWAMADTTLLGDESFQHLESDRINYTKKSLSFVGDCLHELYVEQHKLMDYQRDSLRQQTMQKQFLEKRRQENDQRKLKGEEELPMMTDTMSFRRVDQPSQLSSLLMSSRVDLVTKEVKSFASQNLAKTLLLYHPPQRRPSSSA